MDTSIIEANLLRLTQNLDPATFIYGLLEAYSFPKSTIARIKKGDLNISKNQDELLLRKKLFFKKSSGQDLHHLIDDLRSSSATQRNVPRFILVTDFSLLLAFDTKTKDSLDIPISELSRHYDFFLPWTGREKIQFQNEAIADIKAATRMGQLYDILIEDNPGINVSPAKKHQLNIFLSRLLFCFFAEDTEIFKEDQFTNVLASHTLEDGSDLQGVLKRIFLVLNTKERSDTPNFLQEFPYVNGGLFSDDIDIPIFSKQSRKIIIESGSLDWSSINPDIFGSMMQAVADPDERSNFGMHYTSVVNIMKVLQPLILDRLYSELDKAQNSEKSLEKILGALYSMKIFDPACGSGNFLIIAYKELCRFEIEVYKKLQDINTAKWSIARSGIKLSQFYGITLNDFDHEIAKLSLWLAEHQMNLSFADLFGESKPSLPLREAGNIVCNNANRVDWLTVCPNDENGEIFILGNPPYLGGKSQSKEQKEDMEIVFSGNRNFKELDYISCWFIKASNYIKNSKSCSFAFVTTTSICEGAQVEQLWPLISSAGNEIFFAYKPFDWTNNARDKAGVTCSIIGIKNRSDSLKYLYEDVVRHQVKRINGYLVNFDEIYITKKTRPISELPIMITGNSPYDGGNLMLTKKERDDLCTENPHAEKFIRRACGADEYINGIERYCLWISDAEQDSAKQIPEIARRIESVRAARIEGGDVARAIANRPHQFRYTHTGMRAIIIVPIVSSSRRKYIPIGLLDKDTIILSSAAAIYDGDPYVMGIISSSMHMAWVKRIAGRLRSDIRYLTALCYNTFPFPPITDKQKSEITKLVLDILNQRERFSERTLANLYDPEKMPENLKAAHEVLDSYIENCYRKKPFTSDEERLEYLFDIYKNGYEKDLFDA